jgi:hypothetical protein
MTKVQVILIRRYKLVFVTFLRALSPFVVAESVEVISVWNEG